MPVITFRNQYCGDKEIGQSDHFVQRRTYCIPVGTVGLIRLPCQPQLQAAVFIDESGQPSYVAAADVDSLDLIALANTTVVVFGSAWPYNGHLLHVFKCSAHLFVSNCDPTRNRHSAQAHWC